MRKAKQLTIALGLLLVLITTLGFSNCQTRPYETQTAGKEQTMTENNQARLLSSQPPPSIDWSLERDSLTRRTLLMNDRSTFFYMYVFNYGVSSPIGYYIVNKVSSVDSQLTNTSQIVSFHDGTSKGQHVLPSPSEDGSYGTNGDGIFGFTPEGIYIEHNMPRVISTVPMTFANPPPLIAVLTPESRKDLDAIMGRVDKQMAELKKPKK